MDNNLHSKVAQALLNIEKSLRAANLWSSEPPSLEALASTQPFAVDTMPFVHWLQFIFLPKMKMLVEAGAPLPTNCSIAPMAEEALKQAGLSLNDVVTQLAEIDHLLSSQS